MNHRPVLGFFVLASFFVLNGCMDISPPVKVTNSGEDILHSIHLPFSRGVYGVGDTDSIPVYAIQITGDTLELTPHSISWKILPINSSLVIDSLGRLTAVSSSSSLASNGVNLIVSYTQGEITKADTAKIFITAKSYDIETFKLSMKDSSRGGTFIRSMFVPGLLKPSDYPQVDLEIKDINDSSPSQLNFANHFTQFLTSDKTGRRLAGLGAITSTSAYPTNLYLRSNIPVGEYWIGLESYMYGRYLKDSVKFKQIASAEVFYGAISIGGVVTITGSTLVAQPCAIAVFRNLLLDTVVVELPPSDYECSSSTVSEERIKVAPGATIKLRALGYAVNTEKEWKVYVGVNSQMVVANGILKIRLEDQ